MLVFLFQNWFFGQKVDFWTNYWNLPNSALASISLGQQWFLVKLDHNLTDMLTVWLVMATTAATPPKMASVVTGSGWTSRKQDAKTRSSVNFMMLVKRLQSVRPLLYFFKPKINKRPFVLCFFVAFYCKRFLFFWFRQIPYLGGGVCSWSIFVTTSDVVMEPDARGILPSPSLVTESPGLLFMVNFNDIAWFQIH